MRSAYFYYSELHFLLMRVTEYWPFRMKAFDWYFLFTIPLRMTCTVLYDEELQKSTIADMLTGISDDAPLLFTEETFRTN